MIHTIRNFKDIDSLPPMASGIKSLILTQLNLLMQAYGDNREDDDDGGIILCCPCGTSEVELKEHFDYTSRLPEFVEVNDGICHALYLTNNEYSVSVIMHKEDLPEEIRKEIDDGNYK